MFLRGITFAALWLCPLVGCAAWIPVVNLCLQMHAFSPIWIYQTSSVKKMGTSSQKRFNIERDSGASKPSKGPKDKEQGRALQAFRKPRVANLQMHQQHLRCLHTANLTSANTHVTFASTGRIQVYLLLFLYLPDILKASDLWTFNQQFC